MGGTAEPKKDEKVVPKEEPKKPNSFADKIKNMNSTETKKEEKEVPKEETKKPNSIADKIKNMSSTESTKRRTKEAKLYC